MNLEEARKVYWLKTYHKTLGDLLDEGYLNQSRLEWAAEKAWDAKLKEAASFLLQLKKEGKSLSTTQNETLPSGIQLPSGMTLEQAKATLWPLPPFKSQPMGVLSETKQISIKDLGYAIENAWDKRVRSAAKVLLLARLDQAIKEPEKPSGYLQIMSAGKSYTEHKQDQLTLIQGMIFGSIMTLILVWSISLLGKSAGTPNKTPSEVLQTPIGIITLLILIVLTIGLVWLVPFVLELLIKRIDKEKENYRKGEEGENRVAEIMGQVLDGTWYLFRNIVLPGRNKADIDAVLVGPYGVWSLEIKSFNGIYRNIGERWEYKTRRNWKPASKSPSRQAKNNAIRLAEFLKADHISQWVNSVIVWTNQENPLTVENPSTMVWTLDRLPDELGNILQGNTISEEQQKKIVDKLEKLCLETKK